MTDKYKDLRDALAAGPKPGKWTWKQVGSFNTPGCAIFWPDSSKGGIHYRRLDSGGGMEQQDAEYIAAANPDCIRTLLAERDAMREALRWTAGALQTSFEINAPVAEADLFFLEGDAKTGAEILNAADSALAQHQGEKHGDQ